MDRARCTLKVRGLDCPNEVPPLRAALEDQAGVGDLGFDFGLGTMTVDYDPGRTDPDRLARLVVDRAGMQAEPVGNLEVIAAAPPPIWRRWWATIASGVALAVGLVFSWTKGPEVVATVAYGLAVAAAAVELFPRAFASLHFRRGRLDIHLLMTLAIVGAGGGSGSGTRRRRVAFLFGLSEGRSRASPFEQARRAVRSLLEIAPETAERVDSGGLVRVVPASEVRPGDRVRVRAGMRVPVDGRVVSGRSSVDQKAITGESIPAPGRAPGDEVFAGSANGEGALEVEATRAVGDSVVARVVERVRAAQRGRTPVERSIERFAAYYTPSVVAVALAAMTLPPILAGASWRLSFSHGLVVLVIACPCALVIGTPVAVVSALAAAARRGVLIKGGQYLEAFGRLRVLAFDKTGTLTRGEPDVVEVVAADGRADDDVLRIAAAFGDRGGHVLGRAIARHARGLRLEVPEAHDYTAVPGLGATGSVGSTTYHIGSHRYIDESGLCPPDFHASLGRAEGDVGTAVALTTPSGPLGWIRLADRPRREAAGVLAELHALGVETVMLTGDNAPTAAALGKEVGIGEQRAGLLPDEKARIVAELAARKGPIGMVGDGVNDAPALAAASVSVAMGGPSSAVAMETAGRSRPCSETT